jgi:hypothetical protein
VENKIHGKENSRRIQNLDTNIPESATFKLSFLLNNITKKISFIGRVVHSQKSIGCFRNIWHHF